MGGETTTKSPLWGALRDEGQAHKGLVKDSRKKEMEEASVEKEITMEGTMEGPAGAGGRGQRGEGRRRLRKHPIVRGW